MRTASRFLTGFILAAFVSCPAIAADPSPPPNYQGLWWNAPPGSESGWGINVSHQGDVIFATWFTYDAAGDGWWLAMTANRTAEGTYAGSVVETTGPAFSAMPFDPARVTRVAAGSGTLTFRDPDNGTFAYAVRGAQQSKSITRLAFGPLPACTYGTQPDFVNATNYQDLWWAAGGTESGWGINLAHQGDALFATWFTYDADGTPQWLAVTAARIGQTSVYSGQLIRTTGPAFSAVPFDPARVTRTVAGTATFSFANGNAGTFAYTLDGVSQTKAIARYLFVPPAGTRCAEPVAATVKGKVFDGSLAGARVCADANGNGRCESDEVQALSDATGAYELVAPASFNGPLVAEAIAGQTREVGPSGATVDRSYRMASPAREYGSNITPFTTLVRLSHESNFRVAEEIVRNELGLPPGFRIGPDAAPAEGSLAQAVAKSVVAALKDTAATLDFSSTDALAKVVAAFPSALTALPQLSINTHGTAVDSREIYVDAVFKLTNPAASPSAYELNGRIRGRGNSTWWEAKKPYKVQFTNDAAYAKVPDVLGMKKNRNWALLAEYMDRSLIRNKLALSLGNSSLFSDGLKWTSSGQHVEVTLNGDYVGVYLLTEDIRIDSARLNIRKMSSSAAANQVDGGYIVEVDYPLNDCYYSAEINLNLQTPQGVRICIDTPDEEAITPAQIAFIRNAIDSAESDIYGSGTLAKINPVSFADWYLLQELFRNNDAVFYSSDFMWKDTAAAANPADRVLNMGPIWDFDRSAGNTNQGENWMSEGCWVSRGPTSGTTWTNWYKKLFDHPEFVNLTLARWKDKRPALERLVNSGIAAFSRRLEHPQERNFARWPVLGTQAWHNYYVFATHAEEVAFLRSFLRERMAWLDHAFASPSAFAALCK